MGSASSVQYYWEILPDESGPSELAQCPSCGRNFKIEALERHVPICQRSKQKPKKVFDMKAKRQEAIIKENEVDNAYEVFDTHKRKFDKARRNSFVETNLSQNAKTTKPKVAPLKRKPANAPRGGPPKPDVRKSPTPLIRTPKAKKLNPKSGQLGNPGSTPTHRASMRSRTPSRNTAKSSPSPDVNGNSRKTTRNFAMRRAASSPNIDTNNNKKDRAEPVIKFKEKFPHHHNPHLEALSAAFNKTSTPPVMISIKKPRTVPGVRTGGHSGVEFADPDLLKRPRSSIEIDSGWDAQRFTEDYVIQHSTPKASESMTDLRTTNNGEACTKCNSPFVVQTAKFCFNCGEKRP